MNDNIVYVNSETNREALEGFLLLVHCPQSSNTPSTSDLLPVSTHDHRARFHTSPSPWSARLAVSTYTSHRTRNSFRPLCPNLQPLALPVARSRLRPVTARRSGPRACPRWPDHGGENQCQHTRLRFAHQRRCIQYRRTRDPAGEPPVCDREQRSRITGRVHDARRLKAVGQAASGIVYRGSDVGGSVVNSGSINAKSDGI